MAEKKKLGDLLKEAGLIDDFQLQSALAHQRSWGGKLGTILVELEFVKEEEITRVIAEKMHVPCASLFEPEIPDAVIKLIKSDIAKKYNVVPLKKDAGGLMIAMSDPLDIDVLDAIRFATGLPTKPALAMESEIRDAICKYYDKIEIVRKPAVSFRETAKSAEKMELTRGPDSETPAQPAKQSLRQEAIPDRLLLDSVVSLLVEKDVIGIDELLKMIELKKAGL